MSTFELYLFKDLPRPVDLEAAVDGLLGRGVIEPSPTEHDRAWYRNPDTGVAFPITFSREAASLLASRMREARAGGEEGDLEGVEDAGEIDPRLEEADEDDDGDDEAEGETGSETAEPEAPVLAMTIPTLCPSFVAREAIDLAAAIARSAQLRIEHPEDTEGEAPAGSAGREAPPGAAGSAGPAGSASPEALLAGWDRARRVLARKILEAGGGIEIPLGKGARITVPLTSWSSAKAEACWRYGLGRKELAAALWTEGIRVPVLQAAFHGGAVKTLCDWETWGPAVLPRADLVLVRRRRLRKGLLRTKEVVEEGIADGARVWELVAPLSERRMEPAELLVFRQVSPLPQEVAASLEVFPLQPPQSARRAPLVGVVDFDLSELGEKEGPG